MHKTTTISNFIRKFLRNQILIIIMKQKYHMACQNIAQNYLDEYKKFQYIITINKIESRMQKESANTSIKVIVRVRPLVEIQKSTKEIVFVEHDTQTIKIQVDTINSIQTKFDHAISQNKSQSDVFSLLSSTVPKVLQGFNVTIFAYGQTGSGKTYTMFGKDWENLIDKNIQSKKQNTYFSNLDQDYNNAGIIPRSIYSIFKEFQKNSTKFQAYCSFLQIYNEKIYDLLQDNPQPKSLNIHQSKLTGIFVQGLTEFQVQNISDCLQLMKRGERNRFIRQTSMNAKSSRSHTIFQILIQSLQLDQKGSYIKSRLNLCDLAGSQKINKNQVMVNDHLLQLKNINLSLTTLGKVIYSLSSKDKNTVPPFRDSKLTRLLQQSLTVNTHTFIIGNISPSSKNLQQTINTIKFVQRASHIVMKTKQFQFNGQNTDSVDKLKKQIQYLKNLLSLKKKGMDQNGMKQQLSQVENIKFNNNKNGDTISAQEFQKLLHQNRLMKQQIYKLQNIVESNKSQSDSSYRSVKTSSKSSSSNYSASSELRKEVYKQKFMNKLATLQKNDRKRLNLYEQVNQPKYDKNKNKSLVTAGKSSIYYDSIESPQNQNQNMIAQKQKQKILIKLQQMQEIQKFNEAKIISDIQNFDKSPKKKLNALQKYNNSLDIRDKAVVQKPKRYHQANVFRKKEREQISKKMDNQIGSLDKSRMKKKIDYGDKIKQLQAKLFGR